ncbi:hypothetical protein CCHR01_15824 [Colletotrichum chrysophilum]|uniref:Uncharacterized protein n=1 Tax=Colletotrichum chrysophilum TaxID=1836956 RepID=A0AAD9EAM3_9PEZI|nr:hypothetical protein CCHR01_15824 [Colletotrichum chrysophilum]
MGIKDWELLIERENAADSQMCISEMIIMRMSSTAQPTQIIQSSPVCENDAWPPEGIAAGKVSRTEDGSKNTRRAPRRTVQRPATEIWLVLRPDESRDLLASARVDLIDKTAGGASWRDPNEKDPFPRELNPRLEPCLPRSRGAQVEMNAVEQQKSPDPAAKDGEKAQQNRLFLKPQPSPWVRLFAAEGLQPLLDSEHERPPALLEEANCAECLVGGVL